MCWDSRDEYVYVPSDKPWYHEDYWDDDGDVLFRQMNYRPHEEYMVKWKIMEDRNRDTMNSIMTDFFEKASSVREMFFYFRNPAEGERASCWLWRRVKQKEAKALGRRATCSHCGQLVGPNEFVVDNLMIERTCQESPPFTYTVGGEASYRRAFSHEDDSFVR